MCAKGYYGIEWDLVNNSGSDKCYKSEKFPNCEYVQQTGQGQTDYNCYSCKSGYAVVSTLKSCAAFTGDPNCRLLATGNTFCHYCWHSYYWDKLICKLHGFNRTIRL
jgi:hypothetical protein